MIGYPVCCFDKFVFLCSRSCFSCLSIRLSLCIIQLDVRFSPIYFKMIDRPLLISVGMVVLLTCYDLSRSYSNQVSINANTTSTFSVVDDEILTDDGRSNIPTPKMKLQLTPTVKFLFCQSSGYVLERIIDGSMRVFFSVTKISSNNSPNWFAPIIHTWHSSARTIRHHWSKRVPRE